MSEIRGCSRVSNLRRCHDIISKTETGRREEDEEEEERRTLVWVWLRDRQRYEKKMSRR